MKKTRLDQVAKVEISGVDKKTKPGQQIVRLCNFTDVYYNWAITQDMHDTFMVASASQKEIDSLSLQKGQVALTKDSETRDDIGISTYIADDFEDVVLGYHTALITPDETKLNGKYLNAFLHTSYMQKYFSFNASGSGQRYTLSTEALNAIQLILPTLEEQERIGNLFSLLDRKISLNRSMNAELERMAKEIYDYWFVQFEFPDANGRPYKSSGGAMVYNPVLKREVPQGWEVKTLKDIISSNRGISYNTQSISGGGVPMINLASFNTDGTYKHKGLKLYNGDYTEEKVVHPLDLVLCNTQQTALDEKKDIIGKCFLVPFLFQGDIVCSHHVNIIRTTNKLFKPYLAYLSNTKHFHKFASGCCSGTNIMGLNFDTLQQYKIEIPSRMILEKFYDFVLNIEMQKGILSQEIIQLEDQRDKLLPLLMTGQVKIK